MATKRIQRWPARRLSDCGTFLSGGTPSRSDARFWGGDIPWISAKSLKNFEVQDSEDRLTELGASKNGLLPTGSVLFVVRGMSLAKEFRVGVTARPVTFNQDLRAIIPDRALDSRYLARFLEASQQRILELVDEASHGTKRLTSDRLDEIEIPVPPLHEQRRIADVLDRAEALRAKRRLSLSMLGVLRSALFDTQIGEPRANPRNWARVRIGEWAKVQTGPFGSLLHQEDYVQGGIPLVNPMHIVDGAIVPDSGHAISPEKHASLATFWLREGDVVLGRRGEMGRCAVVGPEHDRLVCGTGSLILRPDPSRGTPVFLQAVLSHASTRRRLEDLSIGATLPNLNSRIVEELEIPLPPVDEQAEFESRLSAIAAVEDRYERSQLGLGGLFKSLQDRAFFGDL